MPLQLLIVSIEWSFHSAHTHIIAVFSYNKTRFVRRKFSFNAKSSALYDPALPLFTSTPVCKLLVMYNTLCDVHVYWAYMCLGIVCTNYFQDILNLYSARYLTQTNIETVCLCEHGARVYVFAFLESPRWYEIIE